jgi:hypothetical protein
MNKISLFRKTILKVLTKLQILCIKNKKLSLLFFFTRLHFYIYYGKCMIREAIRESDEFKSAQHRYACMVMDVLGMEKRREVYEILYKVFYTNSMLNVPLKDLE